MVHGVPLKILSPSEGFAKKIQIFLDTVGMSAHRYEFVNLEEVSWIRSYDSFGLHSKDYQAYAYSFHDADEDVYFSGDLGEIDFTKNVLQNFDPKRTTILHEVNVKDVF